ncbi:MAG: FAD-dependent oxidoreductase [Nitrospinae bacterium]|nr:FAD-dependent oxidoreductase [Nitrospinota bacterium]
MKVLFSSWRGEVVDNRGKAPDDWADAAQIKKLPTEFGPGRSVSAFIGWDGIILASEPYDIVEMTANYAAALQASSCAKCFPCRTGTKVMEDLLAGIVAGKGAEGDIARLKDLCATISPNSKCGIGQLGPIAIEHAITNFRDDFLAYIKGGKKSAGLYYPYKMTAPCTAACPTGMDIPRYIEYIKDGDFAGSLATIREACPMAASLGRACFHPCENNCRRANVEAPLAICKLKRSAWDFEYLHAVEKPSNPNMNTRDEKIAVIGGGIAGVSAAYYLALKGYRVTIFEKLDNFGGAAYTGIPHYRIPKDVQRDEIAYLATLGVELKTGVCFGRDETFKSLREKGFKAVFLATGADLSKKMGAEGEDAGYEGYYPGISILKQVVMKTSPEVKEKTPVADIPKYKHVMVVGGGNTAMDCARTFRRLGSKVTIVYRRTEKELPADPHEIHESKDEGVEYAFLEAPTRIIAENGKVTGLECQTMELGEPDASGRRRPVPKKGSEHIIAGDCVISAIGQDCDIFYLKEDANIKISKWDNPVADNDTMQTDVPGVFAGGDCMIGPMTLVVAAGHGRRAAQSIDQFLRGGKPSINDTQRMENLIAAIGAYNKKEEIANPKGWDRQVMPYCDRDGKLHAFTEVELGYTQEQAMEEAARCMRCYIVGMAAVTGGGAK